MNRRAWLIGGVGAAAVLAGVGTGLWRSRRTGPDGDTAGDTSGLWTQRFERPGGGEFSLAQWRGRPIVLNFWASWCAPCVKEMPELDRFHREQGDHGARVAGLAIDGPGPVLDFIKRVPVSFPVALAGSGGVDLMRALGNPQGGLPFTVLISPLGQLAWRKLGETTREELQRELRKVG